MTSHSQESLAIWQAGVQAVLPEELIIRFLRESNALREELAGAERILVVGAGKAGGAMAAALESALAGDLDRVEGIVNVPANAVRHLKKIHLHAARPAGSNHPTTAGVVGAEEMLRLLASAGPKDVAICLISGGGSALLPAPDGIMLEEKQAVTKLLHASGASINEMNAVRKHLSRIKGGRLAQAFRGQSLYSLIISDVVGDPLSVIASGPTSADPSTFAESLTILDRYGLSERVPEVVEHLKKGRSGDIPETLKELPDHIHNVILANNAKAVAAADRQAESLGYRVLNLGSFIEGETRLVAETMASLVRSIRHDRRPLAPPVCILSGGETTVTLGSDSGKGGRNQEFALALAHRLGMEEMRGVVVLSGGTDGEDGPTDAAGACLDEETFKKADPKEIESALVRHDAYPLLDKLGSLIRVPGGLTETNVMDLRVILVSP